RVAAQLLEVVARGVVEGEARCAPELRIEILESLALELRLTLENGVLRVGEHAVQTTEDGERQDHILVMATSEGVANKVCDAPEEADDLAVVHGHTLRSVVGSAPYCRRLWSRRRSPPQSETLSGGLASMRPALRSGKQSSWKVVPCAIWPSMPRMARFIFASRPGRRAGTRRRPYYLATRQPFARAGLRSPRWRRCPFVSSCFCFAWPLIRSVQK